MNRRSFGATAAGVFVGAFAGLPIAGRLAKSRTCSPPSTPPCSSNGDGGAFVITGGLGYVASRRLAKRQRRT